MGWLARWAVWGTAPVAVDGRARRETDVRRPLTARSEATPTVLGRSRPPALGGSRYCAPDAGPWESGRALTSSLVHSRAFVAGRHRPARPGAPLLRVPGPDGAGLPYSSYIDEGHYLHPTAHMIAAATPTTVATYQNPYEHPSLPY